MGDVPEERAEVVAAALKALEWRRYTIMLVWVLALGFCLSVVCFAVLLGALDDAFQLGALVIALYWGICVALLGLGVAAAGTALTKNAAWGHVMGFAVVVLCTLAAMWMLSNLLPSAFELDFARRWAVLLRVFLPIVPPYGVALVMGWLATRQEVPRAQTG